MREAMKPRTDEAEEKPKRKRSRKPVQGKAAKTDVKDAVVAKTVRDETIDLEGRGRD